MNPLIIETMLQEKRKEMLEQTTRRRLISLYNAANPSFRDRFLSKLGELLIQLGTRIKKGADGRLQLGTNLCQ